MDMRHIHEISQYTGVMQHIRPRGGTYSICKLMIGNL